MVTGVTIAGIQVGVAMLRRTFRVLATASSILPLALVPVIGGARAAADPVGCVPMQLTGVQYVAPDGEISTTGSASSATFASYVDSLTGQATRVIYDPPNWSPITASDETLAAFQFPARPSDAKLQAEWQRRFANFHSQEMSSATAPCTVAAGTPGRLDNAYKGTINNAQFAGLIDIHQYWYAAEGEENDPFVNNNTCQNSGASFWVGLSGQNQRPQIQDGLALRYTTDEVEYSFYELVPTVGFGPGPVFGQAPPAGDTVYEYLHYSPNSNGTTNFFVQDVTTGRVLLQAAPVNTAQYYGNGIWAEALAEEQLGAATLRNYNYAQFANVELEQDGVGWEPITSPDYYIYNEPPQQTTSNVTTYNFLTTWGAC